MNTIIIYILLMVLSVSGYCNAQFMREWRVPEIYTLRTMPDRQIINISNRGSLVFKVYGISWFEKPQYPFTKEDYYNMRFRYYAPLTSKGCSVYYSGGKGRIDGIKYPITILWSTDNDPLNIHVAQFDKIYPLGKGETRIPDEGLLCFIINNTRCGLVWISYNEKDKSLVPSEYVGFNLERKQAVQIFNKEYANIKPVRQFTIKGDKEIAYLLEKIILTRKLESMLDAIWARERQDEQRRNVEKAGGSMPVNVGVRRYRDEVWDYKTMINKTIKEYIPGQNIRQF